MLATHSEKVVLCNAGVGAELWLAPDVVSSRESVANARPLARAWAQSHPDELRIPAAAAFARRALLAYAGLILGDDVVWLGQGIGTGFLDSSNATLAESIGRAATALPQLEALHVLTSLYPAMLPETSRGALGAFYTPPALVSRLLDQAEEAGLDWKTATVLDPATGGAAFLLHSALRIRHALGECEPSAFMEQLERRLQGFEIDPYAAELAQTALEIILSPTAALAGHAVPSFVRTCDTLQIKPIARFDLVVGNPPYGRVQLSAARRARYARSLYGHANLYGLFTDAALRWTKAGGLIAYLTPTSFLAGQYFASLRKLLARQAPPVSVDFVHARRGVFEDALQETMLTVYRKGARRNRVQVHYLNVTTELDAQVTRNGTVALPAKATEPWLAPRSPSDIGLIAAIEAMPSRLADWGYRVSTGPLVWNRFKDQLHSQNEAATCRPLVWAESVTQDGRFHFRATKKNHAPFFELREKDGWLVTTTPCVLVQRTTAKEQSRRLIAAELPRDFIEKYGGVVVENHLNMVWASSRRPKVSAAALAAILNSEALDSVFRCMSGSVAVSAFELEAMPLPSANQMRAIEALVGSRANKAAINQAVAQIYAGGEG